MVAIFNSVPNCKYKSSHGTAVLSALWVTVTVMNNNTIWIMFHGDVVDSDSGHGSLGGRIHKL